jgi:hypothetical protein
MFVLASVSLFCLRRPVGIARGLRFGPIKSANQLYLQSLHQARERWVMRRTADELVTYSVDCLEAHRVVRFFLQLLAQA